MKVAPRHWDRTRREHYVHAQQAKGLVRALLAWSPAAAAEERVDLVAVQPGRWRARGMTSLLVDATPRPGTSARAAQHSCPWRDACMHHRKGRTKRTGGVLVGPLACPASSDPIRSGRAAVRLQAGRHTYIPTSPQDRARGGAHTVARAGSKARGRACQEDHGQPQLLLLVVVVVVGRGGLRGRRLGRVIRRLPSRALPPLLARRVPRREWV